MNHIFSIVPFLYSAGSIEEHEYFGEVLIGIKHVIQNHLREVQVKFQDRIFNLERDLRQRDVLIERLQHRVYELEDEENRNNDDDDGSPNIDFRRISGTGSTTGSSGDIQFLVIENYIVNVRFDRN